MNEVEYERLHRPHYMSREDWLKEILKGAPPQTREYHLGYAAAHPQDEPVQVSKVVVVRDFNGASNVLRYPLTIEWLVGR